MSNDHDARREAVAVSAGALTGAGGRASHAVVVALERGKVCLVGCEGLEFDLTARTARSGGQLPSDGKVVCLDTESGLVFRRRPRDHRGALNRGAQREHRLARKSGIGRQTRLTGA